MRFGTRTVAFVEKGGYATPVALVNADSKGDIASRGVKAHCKGVRRGAEAERSLAECLNEDCKGVTKREEVESRKLKVERQEQGRRRETQRRGHSWLGSGRASLRERGTVSMCPQAQNHYSTGQLLVKQFFKWFVWYGIGERKSKSAPRNPHCKEYHPAKGNSPL